MGSISRACFLRCLLDSHPPIKLIHNVDTIIGRSKITKIKDQSCSRQQLSLKANCEECLVEVKQLGINPSGLDGFALTRNGVYKVEHGSRIEVLLNNYIHVIEFDPPPEGSKEQKPNNKRKLEEDSESPKKRKSLKVDLDIEASKNIKAAMEDLWEDIDKGELYVFTSKGVKSSSKIAAFDMDGTLIKTKSGKVHPTDTHDWVIGFPSIEKKLKEHVENGYKLVILSNQAPIGSGRVKINDFKKKIEAIVKKLDVPFQVFLATGKGIYRKPSIGMWKTLSEQKNGAIEIDMDQSFYVGDAAGRLANWAPAKKKDHSMADKLMAENLGLKFYTPEQFFLGHSIANVPMAKPEFHPKDLKAGDFDDNLISKEKEILVLVGFPGSGKSFLAKLIEKKSGYNYTAVCRDVLGSWQKCAAEATKLLQRGKSVIVDSTNPDKESRARWVSLAKESKVQCRCARMSANMAHSRHNNKFRELMKINHLSVNDIVYHTYKNKFVEPSTSEGFKEVINVHFNPFFEDEEAEKLYRMHLLEK
ncbi:polynucleotide kinase 3'-phosphatase [Anticarsia gemmatalis]|uniref:polynucleotide kinase 3'-phosphatase n=1 Tax=Anticarsia gemmatalis TaxID=129554 RepID=UPI003F771802